MTNDQLAIVATAIYQKLLDTGLNEIGCYQDCLLVAQAAIEAM